MSPKALDIRAQLAQDDFTLDVDLTLPANGCTGIFGPSGSGKSTLLRLIAGFERPTGQGRIGFNDAVWLDTDRHIWVPPHRRGVGMVFQASELFSHLDVAGNLEFAVRRSHEREQRHAHDDVVQTFSLRPLLSRDPTTLSGGERQRVSLARTLLAQPDIVLLDEPLSALDRAGKDEILPFLERLPTQFGVSTLYVSHDIDEIGRLADTVVLLDRGDVKGCGPALDVVNSAAAAALQGSDSTLLDGVVSAIDEALQLVTVTAAGHTLTLPLTGPRAVGTRLRLRIAARDVVLANEVPTGLSIRNALSGQVVAIDSDSRSAFALVRVSIAEHTISAQITRAAVTALRLEPGKSVYALVKSASMAR